MQATAAVAASVENAAAARSHSAFLLTCPIVHSADDHRRAVRHAVARADERAICIRRAPSVAEELAAVLPRAAVARRAERRGGPIAWVPLKLPPTDQAVGTSVSVRVAGCYGSRRARRHPAAPVRVRERARNLALYEVWNGFAGLVGPLKASAQACTAARLTGAPAVGSTGSSGA